MAPKFGTSGLRGLVVELTPELVGRYVRAFIEACDMGTGLYVARDLRASSPQIADVVVDVARRAGLDVTDCGPVPTPALALASMRAGAAAIMVTGSHIPADRNGLKFYLPGGEISKADEAAILAAVDTAPEVEAASRGGLTVNDNSGANWCARYVGAFGAKALSGLRIGVWSHSAVSRDLLCKALSDLGAEVTETGRSEIFVPVDTEAVPDDIREKIRDWITEYKLDALVSTDGDGDRPLLADEAGQVVPGDILGQMTSRIVGAKRVVTPVSSNTGVDQIPSFDAVIRTRIGSPFVIAAMDAEGGKVVGYEANGGYLLGFEADLPAGKLSPLATRDSMLPLVAPLTQARAAGGLSALVAKEPPRFTAADRLENIPTARSLALIESFKTDRATIAAFLAELEESAAHIDDTDGLRITSGTGRIVHFRPSGNAPEFRLYTEAATPAEAVDLLARGLAALRVSLSA
jgi:phosphomannomutase